jgi:(S)-sulfolactate dehydrogenase
MRIVISEFIDDSAVAALGRSHEVVYDPGLVDRPLELETSLATAEALIVRNRTRVSGALLAAAPRLRVVGRLGVGLDNIDTEACTARGVEVIPATGANARAVAEYVIAAALLLLRGAYAATEEVAAGRWPRAALSSGREICGKTIGLIGFGSIGQASGALARAVGMRAIGFDAQLAADAPAWANAETVACKFDEVVARSDVLSLHVPLVAGTRNLLDAPAIASMPRGAILVNTSRGGVVDEVAVAAALRAGMLGGAALDVFESEPLPAGSPLAGCPRLILTPHIAGLSREANARVSALIAERVAAALARKPH